MTNKQIEETIKYFESAINVCEIFPMVKDSTLEAYKNAIIALHYYQAHIKGIYK